MGLSKYPWKDKILDYEIETQINTNILSATFYLKR